MVFSCFYEVNILCSYVNYDILVFISYKVRFIRWTIEIVCELHVSLLSTFGYLNQNSTIFINNLYIKKIK